MRTPSFILAVFENIDIKLPILLRRDRELQIRRIEEARQRREKEHGRNYVLKAYLSSLTADNGAGDAGSAHPSFEADGAAGLNSDSGVHEGGSSPDGGGGASSIGTASIGKPKADSRRANVVPKTTAKPTVFPLGKHKPKSKREYELFRHHENNKELIAHSTCAAAVPSPTSNGLDEQIEWLEKIVVINKQLQREEELIVRLNAKLTKCRSSDPSMSMAQLSAAIGTVNSSMEYSTGEAERVQREIDITHAMLGTKEEMIARMSIELHALESEEWDSGAVMGQQQQQPHVPSSLSSSSSLSMEPKNGEPTEPSTASMMSALGDGGSMTLAFMQMGTLV